MNYKKVTLGILIFTSPAFASTSHAENWLGSLINVITKGGKVDNGANKTIDVHSNCKKITNSSSNKYFIPTKTVGEWNAFLAHKPANVTAGSCVTYSWISGGFGACGASCSSWGYRYRWVNCYASTGSYVAASFCNAGTKPLTYESCYNLASCSTNGSCNNSYRNACYAGSSNDGAISDTSTYYRWRCDGYNGGSNSGTCQKAKPVVVGSCNNATRNACTAGTSNNGAIADTITQWRWRCDAAGGNSGTCSKNKPNINGGWGAWGGWSGYGACFHVSSATSCVKIRYRRRHCNNPEESGNGSDCSPSGSILNFTASSQAGDYFYPGKEDQIESVSCSC